MTGVLLNSGNLQDYTALGDEGQPIHAVATQIREVIRMRVSAAAANSLAIPRINENRSSVDWYAGESGTVVPWAAASEIERAYALECLDQYKQAVTEGLSTISGVSERERQVILNLKDKIFTHPTNNCVFLVNGNPVLTFWGFYAGQAPAPDPFSDLRASPVASAMPASVPPVAPVAALALAPKRRPWWLWLLLLLLLLALLFFLLRGCSQSSPELPLAPVTAPAIDEPVAPRVERLAPEPTESIEPEPEKTLEPIDERERRVRVPGASVQTDRLIERSEPERSIGRLDGVNGIDSIDETLVPLTPLEPPLPDSDADTLLPDGSLVTEDTLIDRSDNLAIDPSQAELPVDELAQTPEVPEVPTDLTAPLDPTLVPDTSSPSQGEPVQSDQRSPAPEPQAAVGPRIDIPSDAVRSGSVSFTDGRWRAAGGLQDSATGKPVQLWYEFKDGKGTVTVDKGAGVLCQTNASSQMQGERLLIAPSPAVAQCADGTALELPTIECAPQSNGPANCQGVAADGTPLPIIIRQSP